MAQRSRYMEEEDNRSKRRSNSTERRRTSSQTNSSRQRNTVRSERGQRTAAENTQRRRTSSQNEEDFQHSEKRYSKRKKKEKRLQKLFRGIKSLFSGRNGLDRPFLCILMVLLVVGIGMMFSASYTYSYYTQKGDSYFFVTRQLIFATIGVAAMIVISFVNYRILSHPLVWSIVLLVAFILLISVLFMPTINGVHRWIDLGIGSFQASEVLKFALILACARWNSSHFGEINNTDKSRPFKERMEHTLKYIVGPYLGIGGFSLFLLYEEPHYSCMVIVVLLLAVMLFASGLNLKWFVFGGAAVAAIILFLYFTDSLQYAMERVGGWGRALDDNLSEDMQWDVWQTMNSLYAIGSGGLTGLGLGQSRQKYLYLPEPQNDFVFAIVVEELGFIGGVIILLAFAVLVYRGFKISLNAQDRFGKLLGVGLISQIGIQVVINILVVTDTLPNTGISLPFFSYGGTSLLMLLVQMGIILSISRSAGIEKQ